MIQLARALKRKYYHFDEIFITGCTGSCLPAQLLIRISSKWRHFRCSKFMNIFSMWLAESGSGSCSYGVDYSWNQTIYQNEFQMQRTHSSEDCAINVNESASDIRSCLFSCIYIYICSRRNAQKTETGMFYSLYCPSSHCSSRTQWGWRRIMNMRRVSVSVVKLQ